MTPIAIQPYEEQQAIIAAMDLIYSAFGAEELNGFARRTILRIAQRFQNHDPQHVGGRGMDHWTDAQLESGRRTSENAIFALDHEINELQRRQQRHVDELSTIQDEIAEREADAELSFEA